MELLDVEKAAARLGVSGGMVRRWCRQGVLVAVKVGSTWAIEAASVEALRREREGR